MVNQIQLTIFGKVAVKALIINYFQNLYTNIWLNVIAFQYYAKLKNGL